MKRLALLLVVFSFLVGAQAYAEEIKIGSIDLIRALNDSDAGKKAKSDLELLIKTKQAALDEKGKAFEKMKGDIEKQSSALSAEARKAKEEELEKMARDYQRLVADSQSEIKKKEGEFTNEIIKDMRAIIEKIGASEGYTIILEGSDGQILFKKKEIDLTDVVIKKHNELKAAPKK